MSDSLAKRPRRWQTILLRTLFVAAGLFAWFWTQAQIGSRPSPEGAIGDGVLEMLAEANRYLAEHPQAADGLLIGSSLVIDLLGVFMLASAIFGPSVRPFLSLLMLFALRQICQALCALQAPPGLIWRHPGMPSLLVTYHVATDFFFSGHTGLAVLGAVEFVRVYGRRWLPLGVLIIVGESLTVLVLRVHYFMDVFTGAVVAGYVSILAARWAPAVDGWLAKLSGSALLRDATGIERWRPDTNRDGDSLKPQDEDAQRPIPGGSSDPSFKNPQESDAARPHPGA